MSEVQKYVVVKDRVDIYRDFTINLLFYILKYYIDRESLSEDEDIRNHFVWCYNKACDDFKKEEIDFSKNEELLEYFYVYYYNQFYTYDGIVSEQDYIDFWNEIFIFSDPNNKILLSVLIEMYIIFDKSISEENLMDV
ncbi:MAG: hypothetical protein ACOC22_00140 [bacterium]